MSESNYKACPDIAEHEKKKKQLYLKDNIMTHGYDPDDFATFLEEEKEGGTNIENWTYEELETLVHIFRKSKDKESEELGLTPQTRPASNADKINDLNSAILSRAKRPAAARWAQALGANDRAETGGNRDIGQRELGVREPVQIEEAEADDNHQKQVPGENREVQGDRRGLLQRAVHGVRHRGRGHQPERDARGVQLQVAAGHAEEGVPLRQRALPAQVRLEGERPADRNSARTCTRRSTWSTRADATRSSCTRC